VTWLGHCVAEKPGASEVESLVEQRILRHRELTERIVGGAIEVHRALGPGLLESVYEACLCHELQLRGLAHRRQVPVPLVYKGTPVAANLVIDVLVEDKVIVELKSVDKVLPVHDAQLLTYMKLTGTEVGLLINFNVPVLKNGITRRVL
jgi:GxxExxY protein